MSKFFKDLAERAVKTFGQFYLGSWLFLSGDSADFDHLFTTTNVKAGVVGLALSAATSLGSKKFGPDQDSASVV